MDPKRSDRPRARAIGLSAWVLGLAASCIVLVGEIVEPTLMQPWFVTTGFVAAGTVIGSVAPITRFKNGITTFVFTFVGFILAAMLRLAAPRVFDAAFATVLGLLAGACIRGILEWQRARGTH